MTYNTPINPSIKPAALYRVMCSLALVKWAKRIAIKGPVAIKIAALPESNDCSPQGIRKNGRAQLKKPISKKLIQIDAERGRRSPCIKAYTSSTNAAINMRPAAMLIGPNPSRAYLMA